MPVDTDPNRSIVMKQNPVFLFIGACACLMSLFGIHLLFGLLPLEDGYTPMDIFGVIFVCVWIIVVLCMGLFALETCSRKISIDHRGVYCRSWFRKDFLAWSEIRDWGLSYCGQTRGEGNTYYLYFSPDLCTVKNEFSKKLKGKMLKTFVIGDDYADAINKIIPFCREKTGVVPFVAEDEFHLF